MSVRELYAIVAYIVVFRSRKPVFANTKLQQAALHSWIGSRRLGVAGTITFRPYLSRGSLQPEYLTVRHAQSCVRHYLKRLDRAAFGSSGARKGHQVGVIAAREGWDDWGSKHLHYHLAFSTPDRFTQSEWAGIAHKVWTQLDWASPDQNRFNPMWSDQWLSYILKTRDKPNYLDAMDYENWRLV